MVARRRRMKVIRTGVDEAGNSKLRIVLNLNRDRIERYGLKEGTEIEVIDKPDGILLKKKT